MLLELVAIVGVMTLVLVKFTISIACFLSGFPSIIRGGTTNLALIGSVEKISHGAFDSNANMFLGRTSGWT